MNIFKYILKLIGFGKNPNRNASPNVKPFTEFNNLNSTKRDSISTEIPKRINTEYLQPKIDLEKKIAEYVNAVENGSLVELKTEEHRIYNSINKELFHLKANFEDVPLEKVSYQVYIICPGCKIGGYMSCPHCLGSGGWYDTVYGAPPKDRIIEKTDLEVIEDTFKLAKNTNIWEPKLEKYFEEKITALGERIEQDGIAELIEIIQATRTQNNITKIKDKIFRNYSNNPHQSIIFRHGNIVSMGGELVKKKGELFIVRTPLTYCSYRFKYSPFIMLLDELIESSSALKANNKYYLLKKNIELEIQEPNEKHFLLLSTQTRGIITYFYILKSLYDEIITEKAIQLNLSDIRSK